MLGIFLFYYAYPVTKRPTIHDVAALAGVSKSLVALVFKQDSGVSEARRDRVLAAAKQLGYTPNAWARTLRSNSGGFVGIIVADFHNPIFTEVAEAARKFLAGQGVFSFVSTASVVNTADGRSLDPVPLQHLLDLKPSSLFIVGGLPNHSAFKQLSKNMPIVVALASAADLPLAVAVRSDDNQAMRLLTDHLAQLGHKNLAYVGPEGSLVADQRRAAFDRQVEIAGLSGVYFSTGTDNDEKAGAAAASIALAGPDSPTAIVAYNDNIAFGVQEAVDAAGVKNKVAVTGYDNTYIAQLERINLTSVAQEIQEIAARACELLTDPERFELARGKELLVSPSLVIRGSSVAAVTKSK